MKKHVKNRHVPEVAVASTGAVQVVFSDWLWPHPLQNGAMTGCGQHGCGTCGVLVLAVATPGTSCVFAFFSHAGVSGIYTQVMIHCAFCVLLLTL